MKALGAISPDVKKQMKASLVRNIRMGDEPCRHCDGTGLAETKSGTIFCPACKEGRERERQRDNAEWLERVERETGVPAKIRGDVARNQVERKLIEDIRGGIAQHQGTYLYGGVGVGKSTAAAAALLEFVRGVGDVSTSPRSIGAFTTASDYLQSIRDSYNGKENGESGVHVSGIALARVVVLDDVGVEYITDWGAEQITRLVDHRVSAGLPTIYTSNLTLDQLEARYNRVAYPMGSRIVSRIVGSCEIIEVTGPDWRRQ